MKIPLKDTERYTIATLRLLGLGRPVRSGGGRLLAHQGLLVRRQALPAGDFGHGRLVASWRLWWARAGSQEDGGRGDVDVLSHQSVLSARGGGAQSHGCCQDMAGLRRSLEARKQAILRPKYKVPPSPPAIPPRHTLPCGNGNVNRGVVGHAGKSVRYALGSV